MITTLALLFLTSLARADEDHDGKLSAESTVKTETFSLGKRGRVVAVIRNDGHAMGNEFVLELRPDCGDKPAAEIDKLAVANVRSGCKIDAKTLKFDSTKEEISVMTYAPDADDYNRQTMVDPATAEMHCKPKPFKVSMPTKKICAQK